MLGRWQSSVYTLYVHKTPREILCGVAKELEATQESHQVLSSVDKGSVATDQKRSLATSRGVAVAVEKLSRYRLYILRKFDLATYVCMVLILMLKSHHVYKRM